MRDVSLAKRRKVDTLQPWKAVKLSGSDLQPLFNAQSTGDVHFGRWMVPHKPPQYPIGLAHALWQGLLGLCIIALQHT